MKTRRVMILAGLLDSLLGAAVVLIYFGLIPVDLSGWDFPRWVVGLAGGLWFTSGFGILMYFLMQPEDPNS